MTNNNFKTADFERRFCEDTEPNDFITKLFKYSENFCKIAVLICVVSYMVAHVIETL